MLRRISAWRDLAAWMKAQGMQADLHSPSVDAFHSDRADGAIPVEVECQGLPSAMPV